MLPALSDRVKPFRSARDLLQRGAPGRVVARICAVSAAPAPSAPVLPGRGLLSSEWAEDLHGRHRGDDRVAGIGYMVVSIAAFAAMDAVGKWLTAGHSVFQRLAVRCSVAVALLLLWLPAAGGRAALTTR